MQSNSNGQSSSPSQPGEEFLRTPRARGTGAKGSFESNTRTRARRVSLRHKEGAKNEPAWGGARNRKNRETTALKQEHAEGILRAIAVAELKGLALNRFWTVNYEWAGIDDSDGAAFIGRLLALCRRYARARGGRFAAVWVREIGASNGAHVHIALHFPTGWKLSGALIRKWIKQAGGRYRRKVSLMRPIGTALDGNLSNPELYWVNAEATANYTVKGSAEAVAVELGLERRKYGGRVIGKRWGRTQNVQLRTK